MDEALRDLVVMAGIAALCFVGAVEYVYWRFGFDTIGERLEGIHKHVGLNGKSLDAIAVALHGRKVA